MNAHTSKARTTAATPVLPQCPQYHACMPPSVLRRVQVGESAGRLVREAASSWQQPGSLCVQCHAAGAAPAGQGSSASRTPAWLIVAIVVPIAVLVSAVAALATLIIRKRQLERRKPAAVDTGLLKVRRLCCIAWRAHVLRACLMTAILQRWCITRSRP